MRAPQKVKRFGYQPLFEEESEDAECLEEFNYITDALKTIRRLTPDKTPLEEESYNNEYILELINHKVRSLQTKPEKKASEMVPRQFHQYLDIFEKKPSERMPLRKPWDHAIDLNENFVPRKAKLYPCSPTEREEIDTFIDDQLAKGYIRPSKSDQTSPIFFIPKKDGKKCMVQDYRHLNEGTIKTNYPLPLIPELIDHIGDAKLFTKMDLRWGYNNICIREGDKWKAAFTCHRGAFKPLVMFFGLCNSPATFQTMMNELFKDMPNVVVYIDDILIFTKNEVGHDAIVLEVLKCLKDNDLFLKPEKCHFKVREVEMLGLIIGPEGIKMDPSKVKAIVDWPYPKKVKEVQSFLGLANYY